MRLILVLVVAALVSACGVPTGPTRTQVGRNVDGSPHYLGDPYQPWVKTDVSTGDYQIKHPPTVP